MISSALKIVLVGNVEFSKSILLHLKLNHYNIVGVITRSSSVFNADYCNLAPIAEHYGIPYKYFTDINSDCIRDWLLSKKPDLIVCVGISQIMNNKILSIPNIGTIGFHPSKLPYNRGRHPIIWALAMGHTEIGSTFFLMDEGADTGPILSQQVLQISENDYAYDVQNKVTECAKSQIISVLETIEFNMPTLIPQTVTANSWRKRGKRDGIIDWRMSAVSIRNLVRALSQPYPGASFFFNDLEYQIWKAEIIERDAVNSEPGKILQVQSRTKFIVKCGFQCLQVLDTQPPIDLEKGNYL